MKLTRHIAIRYIGMASVIILLSIPILYYILKQTMYQIIDNTLRDQKEWVSQKLQTMEPEHLVSYDIMIIIAPTILPIKPEIIYNEMVYLPEKAIMQEHRILAFTAVVKGQHYTVRIQRSLLKTETILKNIILLQSLVLILLILSMLMINKGIKKTVWKPFYHTLDKLKGYSVDKEESLDLEQVKISEINDLNKSLSFLVDHNRKLFVSQKEFTEDASHELQTPLAIIQSNLDLLWQTSPLSEEQAGIISNLSQAANRMNRLNKALLLLAKIENKQYTEKEPVEIHIVVKDTILLYEDMIEEKNINLILKSIEPLIVSAEKTLIELLINNLIFNAIRHTYTNGEITLNLINNIFRISNTSHQGELDSQKLFHRFQKQSSMQQSTGLGLEICKKICELYNYSISYNYEHKQHIFSVCFGNPL